MLSITKDMIRVCAIFVMMVLGTPAIANPKSAITVNNEGVQALEQHKWSASFRAFRQALKLNPKDETARSNLSVAHHNLALQLWSKGKNKRALRESHYALFLEPSNITTETSESKIIQSLGKDPNSFEDRVELAHAARRHGDLYGAIIELRAALKLKDDPKLRHELEFLSKKLDGQY